MEHILDVSIEPQGWERMQPRPAITTVHGLFIQNMRDARKVTLPLPIIPNPI